MKAPLQTLLPTCALILFAGTIPAADQASALPHKIEVTPEIKKVFRGSDAIEIKEITGTSSKFQVGEVYRVVGVCRQSTLKNAQLYLGNTAERGDAAIKPVEGSSLYKALSGPATDFDITFRLFRPGILHLTIYDMDNHSKTDNAFEGLYLGDVVFKHS